QTTTSLKVSGGGSPPAPAAETHQPRPAEAGWNPWDERAAHGRSPAQLAVVQGRPGYLVGRLELVDGVVVGIGDMCAAGRVNRLLDEVEKIAVGARRHARDTKVADVADVHRCRRDLGRLPVRRR